MAKPTIAAPDNYQAESDAHTMMEHHKIKSDPKRHKAAMAHLQSQLAAMNGALGEGKDTKAHEKAESSGKEKSEQAAGD